MSDACGSSNKAESGGWDEDELQLKPSVHDVPVTRARSLGGSGSVKHNGEPKKKFLSKTLSDKEVLRIVKVQKEGMRDSSQKNGPGGGGELVFNPNVPRVVLERAPLTPVPPEESTPEEQTSASKKVTIRNFTGMATREKKASIRKMIPPRQASSSSPQKNGLDDEVDEESAGDDTSRLSERALPAPHQKSRKRKGSAEYLDDEVSKKLKGVRKSQRTEKRSSGRGGAQDVDPKRFGCCDLVWAKMTGFPEWPGIVARDPDLNLQLIEDSKTKKVKKVHVQFFDKPPSRYWVMAHSVTPFTGEWRKPKKSSNYTPRIEKAYYQALEALKMPLKDRPSLLVEDFSKVSSKKASASNLTGTEREPVPKKTAKPKTASSSVVPFERKCQVCSVSIPGNSTAVHGAFLCKACLKFLETKEKFLTQHAPKFLTCSSRNKREMCDLTQASDDAFCEACRLSGIISASTKMNYSLFMRLITLLPNLRYPKKIPESATWTTDFKEIFDQMCESENIQGLATFPHFRRFLKPFDFDQDQSSSSETSMGMDMGTAVDEPPECAEAVQDNVEPPSSAVGASPEVDEGDYFEAFDGPEDPPEEDLLVTENEPGEGVEEQEPEPVVESEVIPRAAEMEITRKVSPVKNRSPPKVSPVKNRSPPKALPLLISVASVSTSPPKISPPLQASSPKRVSPAKASTSTSSSHVAIPRQSHVAPRTVSNVQKKKMPPLRPAPGLKRLPLVPPNVPKSRTIERQHLKLIFSTPDLLSAALGADDSTIRSWLVRIPEDRLAGSTGDKCVLCPICLHLVVVRSGAKASRVKQLMTWGGTQGTVVCSMCFMFMREEYILAGREVDSSSKGISPKDLTRYVCVNSPDNCRFFSERCVHCWLLAGLNQTAFMDFFAYRAMCFKLPDDSVPRRFPKYISYRELADGKHFAYRLCDDRVQKWGRCLICTKVVKEDTLWGGARCCVDCEKFLTTEEAKGGQLLKILKTVSGDQLKRITQDVRKGMHKCSAVLMAKTGCDLRDEPSIRCQACWIRGALEIVSDIEFSTYQSLAVRIPQTHKPRVSLPWRFRYATDEEALNLIATFGIEHFSLALKEVKPETDELKLMRQSDPRVKKDTSQCQFLDQRNSVYRKAWKKLEPQETAECTGICQGCFIDKGKLYDPIRCELCDDCIRFLEKRERGAKVVCMKGSSEIKCDFDYWDHPTRRCPACWLARILDATQYASFHEFMVFLNLLPSGKWPAWLHVANLSTARFSERTKQFKNLPLSVHYVRQENGELVPLSSTRVLKSAPGKNPRPSNGQVAVVDISDDDEEGPKVEHAEVAVGTDEILDPPGATPGERSPLEVTSGSVSEGVRQVTRDIADVVGFDWRTCDDDDFLEKILEDGDPVYREISDFIESAKADVLAWEYESSED